MKRRCSFIVTAALLCFFLILLWENSTASPLFFFPPPSQIIARLISDYALYRHHFLVTFKEMGLSFCSALLLSFGSAVGMFFFPSISSCLQFFFLLIQSIPLFIFAPMMILFFQWSLTSIVILTTLMISFPLTISLYKGLQAVPKTHVDFFRVHSISYWNMFFSLRLPWAIPYLFQGLRISASFAAMGTIGGEWAGAQEGLGVLINEKRRDIDFVGMWATLFCIVLLSLLSYGIILLVERCCFKKYLHHYFRS